MLSIRIHRLSVACSLLAVVAAMSQMAGPSTVSAKDGGLVGVEGILTSIDPLAGTLVIRSRRGQSVTIGTNSATKIERNGRRTTLASFQLDDRVEAKLSAAANSPALKVEAVGP